MKSLTNMILGAAAFVAVSLGINACGTEEITIMEQSPVKIESALGVEPFQYLNGNNPDQYNPNNKGVDETIDNQVGIVPEPYQFPSLNPTPEVGDGPDPEDEQIPETNPDPEEVPELNELPTTDPVSDLDEIPEVNPDPEIGALDCDMPPSDPYEFWEISEDTEVCPGSYELAGIIINADDVTLDCNGAEFERKGPDAKTGVEVFEKDNVTIVNCTFKYYPKGIGIRFSSNSEIVDNFITGDDSVFTQWGISLYSVSDAEVIGNSVTGANSVALLLAIVNNSTISENKLEDNGRGLSLTTKSNNNFIYQNEINSNEVGIRLCGSHNNQFSDNDIMDNTYSGIVVLDYVPGQWCLNSKGNEFSSNNICGDYFQFDLDLEGSESAFGSGNTCSTMYDPFVDQDNQISCDYVCE